MQKVLVAVAAVAMIALVGSAYAIPPANVISPQVNPSGPSGTYQGPPVIATLATFPIASDTWTVVSYPYWWNAGDNVVGSRHFGLSAVSHAVVHLAFYYNALSSTG